MKLKCCNIDVCQCVDGFDPYCPFENHILLLDRTNKEKMALLERKFKLAIDTLYKIEVIVGKNVNEKTLLAI
jgi:hypothetical protein